MPRKSSVFHQSHDRITSRAFTPQYGPVNAPYFTVYDRIRPVFCDQGEFDHLASFFIQLNFLSFISNSRQEILQIG